MLLTGRPGRLESSSTVVHVIRSITIAFVAFPVGSRHTAGRFHNVLTPAAGSAHIRRAIARGALWRLNPARYLSVRLAAARSDAVAVD